MIVVDYRCQLHNSFQRKECGPTVNTTSNATSNRDTKASDCQADEVSREWNESASYWQKHLGTIRTMFQPVTQALIYEAGIGAGQSVLDVAGGSGEPSLTIAEVVGPEGSVTCTDLVAGMVAGAQSEARQRGLTNIECRQCGADSLPFENDSFDAVVCRLGVMFFPDPLAALREMLRVTKRQGSIALVVWGKNELNPFSYLITDVLARHSTPAPPADPNAPGAFRFGEPGALAGILQEAGASKVKERLLEFQIAAPISPRGFWDLRSEISGTLREKLATMSAEQRDLIAQEAQEAVRQYFPNNQMNFPAQMIIVTGKKA
jgi:ubiquinone/menaquinone biosynthesis C-methylase UbiE